MNNPVLALGESAPMARVTNFAKVAHGPLHRKKQRKERERRKLKTWKEDLNIFLLRSRDWRLLPILTAVTHFEPKDLCQNHKGIFEIVLSIGYIDHTVLMYY